MFKGFYNLASGVLTQTRHLNVIGNNMANISTPGFRQDTFTQTTFQDELIYRIGNTDKSNPTPIGRMNCIVTGDGNVTNYTQGGITPTASSLDFALQESGFFAVQTADGVMYTRNGSFILDDQGYLYLDGVGRVLGTNGPIYLGTDKISCDSLGNITSEETGQYFGRIRVVDFQDYDTELEKTTGDMFTATGAPRDVNAYIRQKFLEDSNVDVISEYTQMMAKQRALQSSAQVLKMYDQLAGRIVQIGPSN
ncbi:MAG: flagellar hook-basal body complex protein [Dorea sp.]|jgi:flagellar basal-body rod protein FlgF|nr:flagellar hook-basal body complex protein [Dorea sp.]